MRGRVKVQIISKGPCSDRFCPSDVAYFCLLYEWLKKKNSSKPNLFTRVLSYSATVKRVREDAGNEVGRSHCR